MTAALAKNKVWPSLGYKPHRGQRLVHRSKARHKVQAGGRREGKSVPGGHELTLEALLTYTLADQLREQGRRREFWIVGPEYSDSEKEFRILWDDLKRLEVPMDKPGSYNAPWAGQMDVSLWGGRFICSAKSAKYPGTLVGEGLSGVVMAEAAKLKQTVWHKYIRPTLADFRGWSLHSSTPEGKNWYYQLWQRGQDPNDPDWESWRFPSWINDIVFPLGADDPEIIDMRKDMTEERFNQEICAMFTEFVGRVFKDFDEEIHVADCHYRPDLPLYLAVDYGWSNPFVALLIQVDVWDTVYVLGEYRTNHKTIVELAKDLGEWRGGLAKKAIKLYPDPSEPGDSEVLARELGLKIEGGTGGELRRRLDITREWLKMIPESAPWEDRVPRLLIDRSCDGQPFGDGGLIREMQDYRYPETKDEQKKEAPELPQKKDDHGPEALGRFMGSYYDLGPKEVNRARVRRAKVSA